MSADALRLLDLEGSGRAEGLVDPRTMPWQLVCECCEDDLTFIKQAAGGRRMALQDIAGLRRFWVERGGLLAGDDLQRLLWMVNTFSRALEVDLQRLDGLSLRDLWQNREWRRLLNHIDHLPANTWSQSQMMDHPEHAARLAESIAARRLKGDLPEKPKPGMVGWSPEVDALTTLTDAVNSVRHAVIAVNAEKGKSPKPPEFMPRPETEVARLIGTKERTLRWRAHESLADRVLRGRREKGPTT